MFMSYSINVFCFHGSWKVQRSGRSLSSLACPNLALELFRNSRVCGGFANRLLCRSSICHALRPSLRFQLRPSKVHSYGLSRKTSTADLNGLVRELKYAATLWGLPLVMSVQGIRIAFDSMPQNLIKDALLGRRVCAQCTGLHLRELTRLQGYTVLPLVGKSRSFPFETGGKQGGVETPDEWRALMDLVLEPVIERWSL